MNFVITRYTEYTHIGSNMKTLLLLKYAVLLLSNQLCFASSLSFKKYPGVVLMRLIRNSKVLLRFY